MLKTKPDGAKLFAINIDGLFLKNNIKKDNTVIAQEISTLMEREHTLF